MNDNRWKPTASHPQEFPRRYAVKLRIRIKINPGKHSYYLSGIIWATRFGLSIDLEVMAVFDYIYCDSCYPDHNVDESP